MALEQSIVMGIALVWLFVRMLIESEREQQRAERYRGRFNESDPPEAGRTYGSELRCRPGGSCAKRACLPGWRSGELTFSTWPSR